MIRAVKDEVLEKLKSKRVSPERLAESAASQTLRSKREGASKPFKGEENISMSKNHLQILNMLEQFERQSPHAINIFMENARQRGIYEGLRGSTELRKHNLSIFTKSKDFGQGFSSRKTNQSSLGPAKQDLDDSYPDLPQRFSKLVTFKSVSNRESPKRHSYNGLRKSTNNNMKDKIVFDSIQEIKGRQKKILPQKLEKLDAGDYSADNHAMMRSSEFEIATRNQDMGSSSMKKTLPSIMKRQDENSRTKQLNLRYNNVSIQEDDEEPRTIDSADYDQASRISKKQIKSKIKPSKLSDQGQKRETIGSASFITPDPNDTVNFETIIQRKTQMLSKVPKLSFQLEKNDRFHDFFKKLCGITQTQDRFHDFFQKVCGITQTNAQPGGHEVAVPHSPPIQSKDSISADNNGTVSQGQILLNPNLIKNLRLSKQNIKAHIAKRYGKVISERLMTVLESCNKTLNNIGYNEYLELIYYCFFSLQSVIINGKVFFVPNMFKMLFLMFDGGNKGFFCEHDIFQILWSIHNGKQGVGPLPVSQYGADMIQSLEQKSNGCSYQIDKSSYADVESFTSFSTNFKDSLPKIKRSVFLEAFQSDLNVYNAEFERLKLLARQKSLEKDPLMSSDGMNTSIQNGLKTRMKLGSNGKQVSQSSDFNKISESVSESTQHKATAKPSSPEQRRLNMLQNKLKIAEGGETKKVNGSHYAAIMETIKKHTQELLELQNDDSKNKRSKQQGNQMMDSGGKVINISQNAFNHYNPVKQIFQEKKKYSEQVEDIVKQEACRTMNFEQLFRISKFDYDIPQFLDDLFQHLTTLSLKELVKKGNAGISRLQKHESFKKQSNSRESIIISQLIPHQINQVNPFSNIKHEELSLMKRQLTFLNLMKNFDELDLRCLMTSFSLLSQNPQEKNILKMFISQQSILDNFKKVFMVHNESIALRLYNILSKGINFNRIYLPTYLTRLHPLFTGELADQMLFVFNIYDQDLNRQIAANDISDLLQNVVTCANHKASQGDLQPCSCRLFKEFEFIYKEYIKQNLMQFRVKKQLIDFEYFLRHVQYSCIIEELLDKLLMLWDRPSIFSHDPKDLELLDKMFEYDKYYNYSYIAAINNQGFSNAEEQSAKRTAQFDKKYINFANNSMPSLKNIYVELTPQNQQQILSQAEEDYAGFMLASHKAEIEIARLMLIKPEQFPKNTRMIKRAMMKQDLGLIVPSESSIAHSEKIVDETVSSTI